MAKRQQPKPEQSPKSAQVLEATQVPDTPASGYKFSLFDFKTQAIIVGLLAFVFYINSVFNEYAHDDGIVIVKNEYVQEGFAGIPKILSRDAYDSYYRQLNTVNQLSGGRYRPLSIVTFAIEQQFLGATSEDKVDSLLKQNQAYGVRGAQEKKLLAAMHIRHFFNVLWYVLSVVVLLYFLRYIVFKKAPLVAFIAAILFAVHPIHTEVVANVKSRDEIMSLLFMCTTFIFTFKYYEQKKIKMLLAALVSYFLAFLSKEYAITMVVLLPLSLYLFNRFSIRKSILAFLPFVGVIIVYAMIRFSIVTAMGENSDSEVLNNPYVFASVSEKLATEISTSLNYLKLLIWPHPLSADYSYNSIPYKDFGSPLVWLSLLVHGGLVVAMLMLFPRSQSVTSRTAGSDNFRRVLCFGIAFYLFHLALICNIFHDIGATMGERLIYHSSVGFAVAVAYLLVMASERIKDKALADKLLVAFMVVVIVLTGIKTVTRNADWKNDGTLFAADIKTVPNSVLVCANVAASYITLADYEKDEAGRNKYLTDAIEILNRTLSIHHTFVAAFLNRGIAWYKLGNVDKAKPNFDTVRQLYPTYPTLPGMYKLLGDVYMKKAWENYGKKGMFNEAAVEIKKGIEVDPANPDLWYNLGGAYYSSGHFNEAAEAWQKTLSLKPDYERAKQGLQALAGQPNKGSLPPAK